MNFYRINTIEEVLKLTRYNNIKPNMSYSRSGIFSNRILVVDLSCLTDERAKTYFVEM